MPCAVAAQIRHRNDATARRAAHARRAAAGARQWLQARATTWQAPEGAAAAALEGGHRRIRDLRLAFPDLHHLWRETLGLLTARRQKLVVSIFRLFRIEPQRVMRYSGGVLTEMQDLWMRQGFMHAPRARGMAGATRETQATPPPALAAGRVTQEPGGGAGEEDESGPALVDSVGGSVRSSEADSALTPTRGVPAPAASRDGLVATVAPVMTILGLELGAGAAQRAQRGELGWETASHLDTTALNAALGHIARAVDLLSSVLATPLLYELVLCGSECAVRQFVPVAPRGGATDAALSTAASGVYEFDDAGHGLRLTEHPLYVDAAKPEQMQKRFAWAVFLLGTNVQTLLAAHGLSAHAAQHVLENLDKLGAAARHSRALPGP